MGLGWDWDGIGMVFGWDWDGIGMGLGLGLGWDWDGIWMGLGWNWDGIGMGLGWGWDGIGVGLGWDWDWDGIQYRMFRSSGLGIPPIATQQSFEASWVKSLDLGLGIEGLCAFCGGLVASIRYLGARV